MFDRLVYFWTNKDFDRAYDKYGTGAAYRNCQHWQKGEVEPAREVVVYGDCPGTLDDAYEARGIDVTRADTRDYEEVDEVPPPTPLSEPDPKTEPVIDAPEWRTVAIARRAVKEIDDVDTLVAAHALEVCGKDRVGVKNAIEERLGEIGVPDPQTSLAREG